MINERRAFLGGLASSVCGASAVSAADMDEVDNAKILGLKRFYRLSAAGVERVRLRQVRKGDLLLIDGEFSWMTAHCHSDAYVGESGEWSLDAEINYIQPVTASKP